MKLPKPKFKFGDLVMERDYLEQYGDTPVWKKEFGKVTVVSFVCYPKEVYVEYNLHNTYNTHDERDLVSWKEYKASLKK